LDIAAIFEHEASTRTNRTLAFQIDFKEFWGTKSSFLCNKPILCRKHGNGFKAFSPFQAEKRHALNAI